MSPNRSDTPAPADAAASGAFDVAAARRAEIIAAAHELYQIGRASCRERV